MIDLQSVFDGYLQEKAKHRLVPADQSAPALSQLKTEIPSFFSAILAQIGSGADFRCYGGYGQTNRNFASVPWVACCHRGIGTRVTSGYFVVLLFKQDMSGCWLSLNQGFKQYQEAFVSEAVARTQAEAAASAISQVTGNVPNFQTGKIDLAATTDLGKGYEAGAISSKFYAASTPPTDLELGEDFRVIIGVYENLVRNLGTRPLAVLPDADGPFQQAIGTRARTPSKIPPVPPGPLPPPQPGRQSSSTGGWRRDPNISARALVDAGYQCELNPQHTTFTARSTGQNFVEAHHLIPMAEQKSHQHSLDVPENVIALCPNCHRMIHHGTAGERATAATKLFNRRKSQLVARGLYTDEQSIKSLYRHPLEDD